MYLRELSRFKFHSVTSSNINLYNNVKNSIFIKSGFNTYWKWALQLKVTGVFFLVMRRTWHFLGLKLINQSCSHFLIELRSSYRWDESSWVWIRRYSMQSSANNLTVVFSETLSCTSLMNTRNNRGPIRYPVAHRMLQLLRQMMSPPGRLLIRVRFFFFRKSLIQLWVAPVMP